MSDIFSSGFLLSGDRQIIGRKNGLEKVFTFSLEQLPDDLKRLWQLTGKPWLPSLEFEEFEDHKRRGIPLACNVRPGPAMRQSPVWTHNGESVTPVWLSTAGEMAFARSPKHKNVEIWPVKPWPDASPFSEPSTALWHCDLFFNIADRNDKNLYGRPTDSAMQTMQELPEAFLSHIKHSLLQRFEEENPLLSIDMETDRKVVFELGLVSSDGEVNQLIQRPSRLDGKRLLTQHLQGRTAVGHNISKWDGPIVKLIFGLPQVMENCWDTLSVEEDLCAKSKRSRTTFALNVPHRALHDAQVALDLARNQYLRQHAPPPVADRAWQASGKFFIRRQPQWETLFPHSEAAPEASVIEDWLRVQSQSPPEETNQTNDWLNRTCWTVPIPKHDTDPSLLPLGPHSRRQADYWRNLLPGLLAVADGQRAILAVRDADRAQRLSDLLSAAKQEWEQGDSNSRFPITSFFVGQDKPEPGVSSFRRGVRRLAKEDLPGDLFLWPYDDVQDVQDVLAEGLPAGLRFILVELPDLPIREEAMESDWVEDAMEGDTDTEREGSDEDEPVRSTQRNLCSDRPDGAYLTIIPLWLHQECHAVSFACLDCRLSEMSDSWHTTRFHQTKVQWQSYVSHESAKLCFPQPNPKELDYKDPATWSPWIEENLIPRGKSLQDWQVAALQRVMPRDREASGAVERSTGGGKSLIFQTAALFRGLEGGTQGLTVVVSPLRALMHDQVDKLHHKFPMEVEKLTGDLSRWEMDAAYRRIRGGETLLLYVAPERFRTKRFRKALNARLSDGQREVQAEYWVFDEAHCVSQWGLEFRPDYRRAAQFVRDHRSQAGGNEDIAPVLQVSATLTATAKKDFEAFFGPSTPPNTQTQTRAPRIPSHITFNTMGDSHDLDSIKQILLQDLEPAKGRAIIFINSRYLTQQGAELFNADDALEKKGLKADYFHARRSTSDRQTVLENFKNGDTSILFATKAFGMGIDIQNIRYVFHRRPPNSLEDFIQELGRAGRDQEPASAFLLHSLDSFGKNRENIFSSRLEMKTIEDCRSELAVYREKLSPDQKASFLIPEDFLARPSDTRRDLEKVVSRQSVLLYYLEQAKRLEVSDIEPTHFEVRLGPKDGSGKSAAVRRLARTLGASGSTAVLISIDDLRQKLDAASNEAAVALLIKADQELAIVLVNTVRVRWTAWALQQAQADLQQWLACGIKFLQQIESRVSNGIADGALIPHSSLIPAWLDDKEEKKKRRQAPNGEFQVRLVERYVRLFRWFTTIGGVRVVRQPNKDYRLWTFGSKLQRTLNASCDGAQRLLRFLQESQYGLPVVKDAEPLRLADIIREASSEYDTSGAERAIALLEIMGVIELTQKLQPEYVRLRPTEAFDTPLGESDNTLRQFIVEQEQQRAWRLAALQALTEIPLADRDDYLHAFFDAENAAQMRNVVFGALPAKSELRDILEHAVLQKRFAGASGENGHTLEQQGVVKKAQTKSLLVNAGPGTGKTYTLLTCIAQRLMASETIQTRHPDGMLPPEQVLVLAYTNAVVMELREKLSDLLSQLGRGKLYSRLNIYTFHGFIRKMLTDDELKGNGTKKLEIDKYVEAFLNVAKKDPARLQTFQTFRHIFVDEFQDVDDSQFEMLTLLKTDRTLITAIGDQDQSIYGYRVSVRFPDAGRTRLVNAGPGMAEKPFQRFIETFGADEGFLTINFRCDQTIVEKATSIFPRNLEARPNAQPGTVICRQLQSGSANVTPDLVTMVGEATKFAGTLASSGHTPSVAVLFRTNSEIYEALDALKENVSGCRLRILAKKARVLDSREVVEAMRQLSLQPEISSNDLEAQTRKVCEDLKSRYPKWNADTLELLPAAAWHFAEKNSIQDGFQRPIVSEFASWVQDGWPRSGDHLFAAAEQHQREQGRVQRTEVVLSTVHRVKGLEYDAVVLASPHKQSPEEQRLYYVGITRARHWLGILEGARKQAILSQQARERFDSVEDGVGSLNLFSFSQPAPQKDVFEEIQEGDNLCLVPNYPRNRPPAFEIQHTSTGRQIGKVAKEKARRLHEIFGPKCLVGLKVVEVIHWTSLGDKDGDDKQRQIFDHTDKTAHKRGYYYIVNVAGYLSTTPDG